MQGHTNKSGVTDFDLAKLWKSIEDHLAEGRLEESHAFFLNLSTLTNKITSKKINLAADFTHYHELLTRYVKNFEKTNPALAERYQKKADLILRETYQIESSDPILLEMKQVAKAMGSVNKTHELASVKLYEGLASEVSQRKSNINKVNQLALKDLEEKANTESILESFKRRYRGNIESLKNQGVMINSFPSENDFLIVREVFFRQYCEFRRANNIKAALAMHDKILEILPFSLDNTIQNADLHYEYIDLDPSFIHKGIKRYTFLMETFTFDVSNKMYWYFHRGELNLRLDRFAEANADFESAILLVQQNTFPMSPCPETIKRAVPAFLKKHTKVDSDVKLIKHFFREGQIFFEKGAFSNAFRNFAISKWINVLDSKKETFSYDQYQIEFYLAKSYLKLGNIKEADDAYTLAVANHTARNMSDIKQSREDQKKLIPSARLEQIKKQKVLENLSAFQRDQRTFAEDLFEKGRECLATGDYDLALECFNLAVKRASNDPRVYIERGVAYQQLKQNGKAIADFKKVLELKPDSSRAKRNLAFLTDAKAADQVVVFKEPKNKKEVSKKYFSKPPTVYTRHLKEVVAIDRSLLALADFALQEKKEEDAELEAKKAVAFQQAQQEALLRKQQANVTKVTESNQKKANRRKNKKAVIKAKKGEIASEAEKESALALTSEFQATSLAPTLAFPDMKYSVTAVSTAAMAVSASVPLTSAAATLVPAPAPEPIKTLNVSLLPVLLAMAEPEAIPALPPAPEVLPASTPQFFVSAASQPLPAPAPRVSSTPTPVAAPVLAPLLPVQTVRPILVPGVTATLSVVAEAKQPVSQESKIISVSDLKLVQATPIYLPMRYPMFLFEHDILVRLQGNDRIAITAGSMVRSRLQGITLSNADIDIHTSASPAEIEHRLREFNLYSPIPGLYHLLLNGYKVEISASKELAISFEEWAKNCDVTINTWFMNAYNAIGTPCPTAYDDLFTNSDLRTPIPPDESFAKDRLRILRMPYDAVRAKRNIPETIEKAMFNHANKILQIHPEILYSKLRKFIRCDESHAIFCELFKSRLNGSFCLINDLFPTLGKHFIRDQRWILEKIKFVQKNSLDHLFSIFLVSAWMHEQVSIKELIGAEPLFANYKRNYFLTNVMTFINEDVIKDWRKFHTPQPAPQSWDPRLLHRNAVSANANANASGKASANASGNAPTIASAKTVMPARF